MESIKRERTASAKEKPKSAQRNEQGWSKAGVAHPAFGRFEERKGPRLDVPTSGRNATVL
jgi:hypothetical protein